MATFRASFTSSDPLKATFHTDGPFSTGFDTLYIREGGGGGGSYELPPATKQTLGGIIVGSDLQITEDGVLSVLKADAADPDNTRPITAAAVFAEIGDINILLSTI